jgi:hypothetical protein
MGGVDVRNQRPLIEGHPSIERASDQTNEQRRFRINLVIFLSVNTALAAGWLGLIVAGIDVHTPLWPWAIVLVLWGGRLALEGRAAYRRTASRNGRFSEKQIRHEMTRMN